MARENSTLVKETFGAICEGIIPEKMLIGRVVNAFKTRKYQKENSPGISPQLLLHTSVHLTTRLE